ncbi:MAG: serine protease [Planctomycetota bacterium]
MPATRNLGGTFGTTQSIGVTEWYLSVVTPRKRVARMKALNIEKDAGVLNALSATRVTPRIVGGTPAAPNRYPWMTALFYRGCSPSVCQFCGGALVRPNWVLTAAHCAAAVGDNTPIDVFLGSTRLTDDGERISVAELIVHEAFDPNTLDNDLALLRLESDSEQEVVPIIESDDPAGLTAAGKSATVIGWGRTSEGGESSEKLLEVTVPIVSNEEANAAYNPLGSTITDNMIAAGLPEGGKDACQGDSGGPFVVRDAERGLILAGATSWGIGCARPGIPGLYTRLSRYGDWLPSHLD